MHVDVDLTEQKEKIAKLIDAAYAYQRVIEAECPRPSDAIGHLKLSLKYAMGSVVKENNERHL